MAGRTLGALLWALAVAGVSALAPLTPLTPRFHRHGRRSVSLKAVDSISLDGLGSEGDALEADASFLAGAIQGYLDEEWCVQDCHVAIGQAAKAGYIEARTTKQMNDLTSVMMYLGEVMMDTDMGDAFVGPWDIANACSDLLMARMGRETCDCADGPSASMRGIANIEDDNSADAGAAVGEGGAAETSEQPSAGVLSAELVAALREGCLKSSFDRYKFLGEVADDEVDWPTISAVVALVMGFRVIEDGTIGAAGVSTIKFGSVLTWPPVPLDLTSGSPSIAALESLLPEEDTDERDSLREILYGVHGDQITLIDEAEGGDEFKALSVVVQFLAHFGFLNSDAVLSDDVTKLKGRAVKK